jgi:transcription factor SFP1
MPALETDENSTGMADMTVNMDMSNMNLNSQFGFGGLDTTANNLSNMHMYIADPARRLFGTNTAAGGGVVSASARGLGSPQLQQTPQSQVTSPTQSAFGDLTDPGSRAMLQQMGVLPGDEQKRYKCPVIGCEKAYKNQNGLK